MEFDAKDRAMQTLDEKVDYYLHKISMAPTLTLDARSLYEVNVLDEEAYLIDQVMIEKGLLKSDRGMRIITGKGLEISNFGGWNLYQKLLRKENQQRLISTDSTHRKYQKEIETLRLQLEQLRADVERSNDKEIVLNRISQSLIKQNHQNKLIAFLAGAITGASLAFLIWRMLAD